MLPALFKGRVSLGRRPGCSHRVPERRQQSRAQSGHGFGGSEDGFGGPSVSITTAVRSAIDGPNMGCTLR